MQVAAHSLVRADASTPANGSTGVRGCRPARQSLRSVVFGPLAPHRTAERAGLCRIAIDRRAHLELAFQRQQEKESQLNELMTRENMFGQVIEIQDQYHYEKLNERIGGKALLFVFFYSRVSPV